MSPEPFEQVVATHGPMVLRVCRAMVGPNDADDVWSDTFIAALRAYPDLAPDSNVAAWLTTIAHNRSIDLLRKRSRTPQPSADVDDQALLDLRLEPADPCLQAALATLTARQRAAVVHHHVAGLPHAQVAELLGSTEAAARRSAADGMAKLRAAYTDEEGSR